MTRFVLNLLTGLALSSLSGSCPSLEKGPPEMPVLTGDSPAAVTRHQIQCRDWREEMEKRGYAAAQRSHAAFIERLKNGDADPAGDAADAARRGEFGLI